MQLPDDFLSSMKELLCSEYDDFIASYDMPAVSSIRINTSKISESEFEEKAPFQTERIPFASGGYYTNDSDEWSRHPYYNAGLYYIQEASAMLPAKMLPVCEGDAVLDLCAAPGGKSTALSCTDIGILVSNDISYSRTIPLVKNLELFGRGNYLVTCESPSKLEKIYRESFDKILVDAPCSGEGMFRKDTSLIASYAKRGPRDYCHIQREILESAYRMCRSGGMILYSTCTFSDVEDEQVILSFVSEHNDVKVCEIKHEYGLCGPYDKYRNEPAIIGCVHAFPHKFRGEGHFLALMKKGTDVGDRIHDSAVDGKNRYDNMCDFKHLPKEAAAFATYLSDDVKERLNRARFIVAKDGMITMLPEGFESFYNRSIRYSRTGTVIGTVNRAGNFVPATAFALSLRFEDHNNRLSFEADDPDVYKYLKGETIVPQDRYGKLDRGFVLIGVDSFPLGFAKYDGVRLKNLYEKGRINGAALRNKGR